MIFSSIEQKDWLFLMSFISCVPCWLGVIRIEAQGLFKKSCLWDKNKLQAASEISCEPFVIPWKSFFTVRITQSTPMSGENSIASFSIEKVILTYFRLMVWKLRLEMSFRITVETNGNSTQLCQKCKFFCPFGHKLVYAWLWLADKFIQKWRWTLSFWRYWTIQISKNNLNWFLHLFTNVYHAVKFKKKLILFVLHREFCGFGRWTWIEDMIINYFKWLKNFLWNKV